MRKLLTAIAISGALLAAGCGTYNGWTSRKAELTPASASCASGYQDCKVKGRK